MNIWRRNAQYPLLVRECLLCGGTTHSPLNLCEGCCADLPRAGPACSRCAVPLPVPASCPACQRRAPPFERGWAGFRYVGAMRALVHALKFGGSLIAARAMGELLCQELRARSVEAPEYIVPVPLHPGRLRQRGYNQAVELGRPLSDRLGLPLRTDVVLRTRRTRPQTDIGSAPARRRNVRRAFSVMNDVRGAHLALLDDVMTTGATAGEISRALRRAGARRVDVWVLARAER